MNVDPAVAFALFFDFADSNLANLSGRAQVRPTTGLQIHAVNVEQSNTALSSWRLD